MSGVHGQRVNLEIWEINPDRDISGCALTDPSISDEDVVVNTEIELASRKPNR